MSYGGYPAAQAPYSPPDPAAVAAAAAAYAQPAVSPSYGAAPYAAAPPYGTAPPAYGSPYAAPPYGAYSHPDEPRTLFLTGFPPDVRERELNNLLRFLPGYEASQLHVAGAKSAQAQGFALFDCGASAHNALQRITSLVFDEGFVLRCEMARKNMYLKDSSTKRSRYDQGGYGSSYGGGYGGSGGGYGGGGYGGGGSHNYGSVSNTKDNPPCNTLFIGNLGEGTDENELRGIFGGQPGFRQIKMNRGGRGITCFVEFSDVASAMAVHQSQQGAVLQSSDRGGVRIQYSKNPFGRKRDFGGNYINDSPQSPAAAPHLDANYQAQAAAEEATKPAFDQPPAEAAQAAPFNPTAAPAFNHQEDGGGEHHNSFTHAQNQAPQQNVQAASGTPEAAPI